ncbi:hypothetical protein RvY_19123 [Ramazzottius varieornatus]|uniref:Uncharacterized protein n=1 Tax=Ramazzottius varieornatus TaxID=947166 RepID=A0A1D1WAK2_RAMVA|nr:hypothetical protein RvY_19123 [Ramazzottius varieornatus]
MSVVNTLQAVKTAERMNKTLDDDPFAVADPCEDVRSLWEEINNSFMLIYGAAYGSDVIVMLGYAMSVISTLSSKNQQDVSMEFAVLYFIQTIGVSVRILLMTVVLILVHEKVGFENPANSCGQGRTDMVTLGFSQGRVVMLYNKPQDSKEQCEAVRPTRRQGRAPTGHLSHGARHNAVKCFQLKDRFGTPLEDRSTKHMLRPELPKLCVGALA